IKGRHSQRPFSHNYFYSSGYHPAYRQSFSPDKNDVNRTCRSSQLPITPTLFPIVNAARIFPAPNPSRCPRKIPVIPAVTARQITSKEIFIFEYVIPVKIGRAHV